MSKTNRNAPELILVGGKWAEKNEIYLTLPDRIIKQIGTNANLTANERLLLMVLIGQAESGFHPSVQWILDRTGMSEKTYIRCRLSLIEKNIIETEDCVFIKINLDNI